MLAPDSDLQAAASHEVDASTQSQVSIDVGRPPDLDLVDGGRHDARVGQMTSDVGEGNVLRELVEHFQQLPKSNVAGDRLIDEHELSTQPGVGFQRQKLYLFENVVHFATSFEP